MRDSRTDPTIIPADRLPAGFAERIDDADAESSAPPARPAATTVPLRDAGGSLEVLLLQRNRATGFVPGAYVFPGGRVDDADSDPALRERLIMPETEPLEPALGYWVAAARELFEETGVLLASRAGAASRMEALRDDLLEDRITIGELLDALQVRLDVSALVYCAHWVTPLAEPRRYDTRFFLAELPRDARVLFDTREMTSAVWIAPAAALDRFEAGTLPMVFPTVKTLESLLPFDSLRAATDAFRGARVPRILPRLVRRAGGVGIVIEEEVQPRDHGRERRDRTDANPEG